MQRSLDAVYGLGRLAFGAALMASPSGFGSLLVGEAARTPDTRISLRLYGTRDVVLGLGALRAVAGGGDPAPWVVTGVMSDALDTAVQLREWEDIPPDRRVSGVLAAMAAAGAGVYVLARRG